MGIRKSFGFPSGYTAYTCVSRRLHHCLLPHWQTLQQNRNAGSTLRTYAHEPQWSAASGCLRADGSVLDQRGGRYCTHRRKSATSSLLVGFCTTSLRVTGCHLMFRCCKKNVCPESRAAQPPMRALQRRQELIYRF